METQAYVTRFAFDSLITRCDLSEASSPIEYRGDDGSWHGTPYQTADARHRCGRMVELVVAHLGPDYWRSPESDDDRDDEEIIHDLVAAAGWDYLDEDES